MPKSGTAGCSGVNRIRTIHEDEDVGLMNGPG
jgi:hypothetical protein